jgi:hypothetical protein
MIMWSWETIRLCPDDFKEWKISSDGTTYRGASGYLGVNVGGQTTFNIERELITDYEILR